MAIDGPSLWLIVYRVVINTASDGPFRSMDSSMMYRIISMAVFHGHITRGETVSSLLGFFKDDPR